MIEALQFDFMQNALLAGLLAAVACGVIGALVVVNRIVFISGGIAHAAYGGVGLAFFLGCAPALGVAGVAVAAAAIMALITLKNKYRADAVIGVLWAVGMALGVILIDLTPGYNVDLMSYLFGSILAVPRSDLWLMLIMDVIILAAVILFYQGFVAISYDEEFALCRGIPVRGLHFLLLILIALSVVMIIRIVGLILVIALISIAPYLAERFARSLKGMMFFSALLSAGFTLAGLGLAYIFNLTSGAAIIMVAGCFFFLFLAASRLREALIRGKQSGS